MDPTRPHKVKTCLCFFLKKKQKHVYVALKDRLCAEQRSLSRNGINILRLREKENKLVYSL
jgi:hypothetical protein